MKKRPSFTSVIALLALFIAIGGTATAAGLISGKSIKRGTITAKQIKNKTITTGKLAPATVAALQGAQGPRGVEGDKGATGIKGDTGIPGIAGPEVVTSFNADNSANVAANSNGDIVSMNGLPSNRYLVIAKSIMFAQTGGALLTCGIETNPGGNGDDAQWNSPANLTRTTVPMVVSTTGKVTQIKVNCTTTSSAANFAVDVVAIPIG